jgi:hypothetical protein
MKWGLRYYHGRIVRDTRLFVVAAMALAVATGSADDVLRTFDQDPPGAPPPGFSFAAARLPAAGRWVVRADGANRYIAHLADAGAGEGFALALLDTAPPRDLRLAARMKLPEGARVGGLVWRYANPDNFYAVSLDLSAQELALYRVSRGNRIRLEFEDDLELDQDAWHVVRVEHAGGRIRVALGGIGVMRARSREESGDEGRSGVWSAGSSTAWFDDLAVQQVVPDRER